MSSQQVGRREIIRDKGRGKRIIRAGEARGHKMMHK